MKTWTLKYRGAFALAAKIAGLLPYGAFALQTIQASFHSRLCECHLNRIQYTVDKMAGEISVTFALTHRSSR